MKKGYAVVQLCANGWNIHSYYFGRGSKGDASRAVRALNTGLRRSEWGVFAAIDSGSRVGLWFEFEAK